MDIPAQCLRGYEWGALLQTTPRSGPRKIPVSYRIGWKIVIWGSSSLDVVGIYESFRRSRLT